MRSGEARKSGKGGGRLSIAAGLAYLSSMWQKREGKKEETAAREYSGVKERPKPVNKFVIDRPEVPDRAFRRREHREERKGHQYAVTNEQTENEAKSRGKVTRRVR